MFEWEVKFYKEVTVSINAIDETTAIAKAMAVDIDLIPSEWLVSEPKMIIDNSIEMSYNDKPPSDFDDEHEDIW